ncbi:MAG: ribosome silencing factor [Proteobacteria bacterium]|nr:ribosome silencing factor [Pseudomonadota bacterium]MBU1387577.1 ribosome silencing factor [Pseudomonadota bacterium]MBU1544052.1 ribosome silencing factor [Pseudomonadota bacterium]MBU2479794.1 ribosome silencing factor [Pseudomonadota bacterium]
MTPITVLPDHLKKYIIPVFERKALSVSALGLKDLTSYTDVIVIVEAASHRQVTSLAQHLIKRMKELKIKSIGEEGVKEGEWALLDYGDIVIHIFESEAKSFYDLEGFWADAPVFDLSEFDNMTHKQGEKDDDD